LLSINSDEVKNMIYNQVNGMMLSKLVKRNLTAMDPYRNLFNYVCEIVNDRSVWDKDLESFILSVDDLSYEEQGELAALLLEYSDRDTTDCFNNPTQTAIDDDITCSLLMLLKKDTSNNREELASIIRENTINRFKADMQEFINRVLLWKEVA
jgi:hypothetical protein